MAIGSDYNNDNGNKNSFVDRDYYSRFRVRNAELNRGLSFGFKSSNLIIKTVDISNGTPEDIDMIYISPTKAYLLDKEITAFRKYLEAGDIDPNKGFGVNSGFGDKTTFIIFSALEDKTVRVTIGRMNGSGIVNSVSYADLNKNYNFSLKFNNTSTLVKDTEAGIEKLFYDNVELDQIHMMIRDFSRAMSGAAAYSVADLMRYDAKAVFNKFDSIFDRLGIERPRYSSNGGGYNKPNEFLNNAKSSSVSYDSIESAFDDFEG